MTGLIPSLIPGGVYMEFPLQTTFPGLYPIHLAAQLGDLNLVVLLLASGADPDVETSKGRTAVREAQ